MPSFKKNNGFPILLSTLFVPMFHCATLCRTTLCRTMLYCVTLFCTTFCCTKLHANDDWLQFRGPEQHSQIDIQLPARIDPTETVKWVLDLPGKGVSGPIVVGDRVFVSCSSTPAQNQLHVVCADAKSGKQIWHRQFWALGRCSSDPTSANAAPTPASDGTHVIAFYSSNDLVCFDLEGNLKWLRALTDDYPKAANDVGMASSPIIYNGVIYVQVENQGDSFIAAVDIKTGANLWKVARPRKASWSSPIIIPADGKRPQMLIALSGDRLSALNTTDGSAYWDIEGATYPIPSPVFDAQSNTLLASINGLSAFHIVDSLQPSAVWSDQRLSPSNVSCVIKADQLYTLNRSGVAICAKIRTGEEVWKSRVGGGHYATPVLAKNLIYYFSQDGIGRILKTDGVEPEVISEYKFQEAILGTPAASKDAIFVRREKHLMRISD